MVVAVGDTRQGSFEMTTGPGEHFIVKGKFGTVCGPDEVVFPLSFPVECSTITRVSQSDVDFADRTMKENMQKWPGVKQQINTLMVSEKLATAIF